MSSKVLYYSESSKVSYYSKNSKVLIKFNSSLLLSNKIYKKFYITLEEEEQRMEAVESTTASAALV